MKHERILYNIIENEVRRITSVGRFINTYGIGLLGAEIACREHPKQMEFLLQTFITLQTTFQDMLLNILQGNLLNILINFVMNCVQLVMKLLAVMVIFILFMVEVQ